MVLQNLGRKVGFGTGSNYSGWHQNVFRIWPLFVGVAALATTLLLGSHLWAFVTRRKNKKQGETPAPLPDLHPRVDYKPNTILSFWGFTQEGSGKKTKNEKQRPASLADFLSRPDYQPDTTLSFRDSHRHTDRNTPNTIVSFRGFNRAPPIFSPKVADYDDNAYFDELDAEEDYAQVVEEARPHGADGTQTRPIFNSPEKHYSVQSWLARSPDIRRHTIISLEDAEAVFARHQAKIFQTHQHKPSKSWKNFLFWKRSKKSNKFEFNLTGGATIHSSRTTPMHHLFKPSRTRAAVAPSTGSIITSNRNNMNSMPKRSTSSPIYYDGTPCTPSRSSRPFSNSACSTPSRDGLYEPTYIPLKRPYSNYRTCPSPLYIP